jgi:hypothetical protein
MVMGQGVGTAAALALSGATSMRDISLPKLQQMLIDDGVYLRNVPTGERHP